VDAGAVRRTGIGRIGACKDGNVSSFQICHGLLCITIVRLKVEENKLVGVLGEIGVLIDGLKGA